VQQVGAYYGLSITYSYAAAGQRHTLRVAFPAAGGGGQG
jgi:hypothetical protein